MVDLTISDYIISMRIIVSKFANSHCLSMLPYINRTHTSFLLIPIFIEDKWAMAVRLLSYSISLLILLVKFGLWNFRMVYSCDSMRMSLGNEPMHPLFLIPCDAVGRMLLIFQSQRISILKLNSVSLKFKLVWWLASKFHLPSIYHSIFIGGYLGLEELFYFI